MELRTLRYFVATVDHGTVSAAAAQMRVTQPSVSRQLRQLERELGVALFDHEPGRLVVNRAGRRFLPLARDLVRRADSAREAASSLAAGRPSHLSIAAPITTLTDVVAPFVATFEADDPVPSVAEWVVTDDLDQLLYDVDLAIVPQTPPPGLEHCYVATFRIWAFVPPDHVWARREEVTIEELVTGPVVVSNRQFKSRRILDSVVELSGLVFTELVETSNGQVAQALACSGRGVAVVTDDPAFDLVPVGIRWNDQLLRVHLYACWRRDHHATALLRRVSTRLSEFCANRYGPSVIEPHGVSSG